MQSSASFTNEEEDVSDPYVHTSSHKPGKQEGYKQSQEEGSSSDFPIAFQPGTEILVDGKWVKISHQQDQRAKDEEESKNNDDERQLSDELRSEQNDESGIEAQNVLASTIITNQEELEALVNETQTQVNES